MYELDKDMELPQPHPDDEPLGEVGSTGLLAQLKAAHADASQKLQAAEEADMVAYSAYQSERVRVWRRGNPDLAEKVDEVLRLKSEAVALQKHLRDQNVPGYVLG